MAELTLPSKEMEELHRRFKKGYGLQSSSSGHFDVIGPDGEKVKTRSGRLMRMPSTPRGGRATLNLEKDLIHAGVIPTPRAKPEGLIGTQRPEVRDAAQKALKIRQQRRQKVANELRARLATVVEPMGGLGSPDMKADLSKIAALLARESPMESGGRAMTPDLLYGSITRLAVGGWIEPRYQEIWIQLVERLESAEAPIDEFFVLVREARGLPESIVDVEDQLELPTGDWPFRVELLRVPLLFLDHSYQRPPDWPFIRGKAASFDERLVGTIDVAQRKQGSIYAILDGQQRFEMMRLVGKTTAWCSIYQGLDVQAEARFFLHKNRDKKAMHPYYVFRARLTAKDRDALDVERIVKNTGYKVTASSSQAGAANGISAVGALEEVYKRKTPLGQTALVPTLETMKLATFGRRNGQNSSLIRGLGRFFESHPQNGRPLDTIRLVDSISIHSPERLLSLARESARDNKSRMDATLARLVAEEYNRGLPRETKLMIARPR